MDFYVLCNATLKLKSIATKFHCHTYFSKLQAKSQDIYKIRYVKTYYISFSSNVFKFQTGSLDSTFFFKTFMSCSFCFSILFNLYLSVRSSDILCQAKVLELQLLLGSQNILLMRFALMTFKEIFLTTFESYFLFISHRKFAPIGKTLIFLVY